MYEHIEHLPIDSRPPGLPEFIATSMVVAGIIALVLFGPHSRDVGKITPGTGCAALSETEISAVLGRRMRLLPTDGTVCRYVSLGGKAEHTLIVVASPNLSPSAGLSNNAVFTRSAGHEYELILQPLQEPPDLAHLAALMQQPKIVARIEKHDAAAARH